MKIKGVFFDLGGTLFRYGSNLGGGFKHILSELKIEVTPEEIASTWTKVSKETIIRFGRKSFFLHKDLFTEMIISFGNTFGHKVPESLIEGFHHNQLKALLKYMPIRDDCLSTLLLPIVDKYKLDKVLDDWSSSEEAKSCKPDPQIFYYALEKSGLDKDEILFVGDSLEHDIAGSHAVGMRSAQIIEKGVVTPLTEGLEVTAEPTFKINQLSELISLIEGSNNGTV